MAAKGETFDNDLLKLIFNGTAIANIADDASSSPLTDLYVSLHTATPSSGDQTTNEATYTSYDRVAVARDASGWTVSFNSVFPTSTITFPTATGGSEVATHMGVGTDSTGTGKLLYFGQIEPTIVINAGVTPQLTTASTITEI